MAFDNTEVVVKCGKTTIRYPRGCAYGCFCNHNHWAKPCTWVVVCRGIVFSGETTVERKPDPMPPPKPPHVKIGGGAEGCAKILERAWNRPVTVPTKLKGKAIRKRTFEGDLTPERISKALGLKLGPKRKGLKRGPKRKRSH